MNEIDKARAEAQKARTQVVGFLTTKEAAAKAAAQKVAELPESWIERNPGKTSLIVFGLLAILFGLIVWL